MILDQFLLDLVERGGSLRVEDDRLLFRGPPGSILACDEEFIRENRAELLERVRSVGPIEAAVEEDEPAWFDDDTLTVSMASVRASMDVGLSSPQAATRPARPADRSRRDVKPSSPTDGSSNTRKEAS